MTLQKICMQGSSEFCKPNVFSTDMWVFQKYFRMRQFGLSQISQYKLAPVKKKKNLISFPELCTQISNYVSQKIHRAKKFQTFQLLMKQLGICGFTSRRLSQRWCNYVSFLKEKKPTNLSVDDTYCLLFLQHNLIFKKQILVFSHIRI